MNGILATTKDLTGCLSNWREQSVWEQWHREWLCEAHLWQKCPSGPEHRARRHFVKTRNRLLWAFLPCFLATPVVRGTGAVSSLKQRSSERMQVPHDLQMDINYIKQGNQRNRRSFKREALALLWRLSGHGFLLSRLYSKNIYKRRLFSAPVSKGKGPTWSLIHEDLSNLLGGDHTGPFLALIGWWDSKDEAERGEGSGEWYVSCVVRDILHGGRKAGVLKKRGPLESPTRWNPNAAEQPTAGTLAVKNREQTPWALPKCTQVQRDSPCSSEKVLVSFLKMRKNDIIRSGVREGPSRTSRLFQKNLKWSVMSLMCLLGHLALSSQTETQWPSRREMLGGAVGRKLEFAVLHNFLMSKERLESCQHALRRWAHRL